MADTVGLLRYPPEWQGAINCTRQYFDDRLLYGIRHKPCVYNSKRCGYHLTQSVQVCACHGYCGNHCTPSSVPPDQMWRNIIDPYVNIAVDSPWPAQVISDSLRKLSALDPKNGLGVLHGLLLWKDDATLLEKFLELGVDADIPFIHSNRNDYTGVANFDLATAEKLNYGTAAHFAAFFGRSKCLQALADVGASFNCKTKDGEKPLDLSKDGSKEIIQDAADGSNTLAWLAKEGKYFAIRYKIRLGKVTPAAFRVQCDGKTAVEWIWAKMIEWQFTMKMDHDSLIPFKIMAEMGYRYDVGAADFGTPPVLSMATDGGASKEANQELLDEVKKVRESQETILESICVLSGNAGVSEAKRKEPDGDGADDGRH